MTDPIRLPKAAKVLPPFYFLIAMTALILLHRFVPVARIIDPPWTWLGMVPAGIAFGVIWSAIREFKMAQTEVRPFRPSTALVTSGPFRLTRNPMYLSMLLVLLGAALKTGTLTPYITIPALAFVLNNFFVVYEERMLTSTFGGEYSEYCQRVRRWI